MDAVWLRLRSELRSRWRSWLALSLLVGVAGGAVLAAAAGARRTDTAIARYLRATKAVDIQVAKGADFPNHLDFDQVEKLPQVAAAGRTAIVGHYGRLADGRRLTAAQIYVVISLDPRHGVLVDRPHVIDGRLERPGAVDEALVSKSGPAHGLRPGTTIRMRIITPVELSAILSGKKRFDIGADPETTGTGPLVTIRIVGVRDALAETDPSRPSVYLSYAFYRAHARGIGLYDQFTGVRLKHGAADLPAFQREVERMPGAKPVFFYRTIDTSTRVQHPVHLQAEALWLAAAVGSLAAAFFLALTLARQTLLESSEYPLLRALGMTRRQLMALPLARAGLIGLFGASLALVAAVALSPLTPVGSARDFEPHSGVAFDSAILLEGSTAILALIFLVAAFPAWRAASASRLGAADGAHRSRLRSIGQGLARAGVPSSAAIGIQMAVQRARGRAAVPVRSTMLGVVVAVAVLAMALTFSASLDHLATTPRLYGQNWDAASNGGGGPDIGDKAIAATASKSWVDGFAVAAIAEVEIGGKRVGVLGMQRLKGQLGLTVIDGRQPSAPDEILLGSHTLNAIGAKIGDTVDVTAGSRTLPMKVIGRGVLPEFQVFTTMSLGKGAAMTVAGLRRLDPTVARSQAFVRFAPGTNEKVGLAKLPPILFARQAERPVDITTLGALDSTPWLITSLFSALAAASLAYTLLSLIRRRRRDLAILKTLGFDRRQIVAAVASQATTVVAVAMVVGLPIGIAAGRWIWNGFAGYLGVLPAPVVPVQSILLVVPATLLVANLVAALPARLAARTRPALVLRAE